MVYRLGGKCGKLYFGRPGSLGAHIVPPNGGEVGDLGFEPKTPAIPPKRARCAQPQKEVKWISLMLLVYVLRQGRCWSLSLCFWPFSLPPGLLGGGGKKPSGSSICRDIRIAWDYRRLVFWRPCWSP